MADHNESEESSSTLDMPMEVLTEILTYLPVKSLIRFTCVCKPWKYLIENDPKFAMKHYLVRTRSLSSSSRLMDNVDCIVDYFGKYGRGCRSLTEQEVLRFCMFSVTEKKTFRPVRKIELGHGLEVSASNFCHGIMCMYVYASGAGARMLLCNPAIGEVVTLPVSRNIATHGVPRFGFGFDSISNDYKIVAAHGPALMAGRNSWLIDVYSVRNANWHSVHSEAIASLEKFESIISEPVLNANGRILNWIGYRKSSEALKGLLSFDMVDEVFREIPMPEFPYSKGLYQYHLLPSSQWHACLCCYCYPSFDLRGYEYFNSIDVWVLNGEQMVWSKQISLNFPNQEVVWPSNLWMNDKELFVYVQKQKGSVEEVFHYNIDTQQLKRTGRHGMLVNPDCYTESLVSIKGFVASHHGQASSSKQDDGNGDNKEDTEEVKDDGKSVYFIREVGRRNNDVRWNYNFRLP